MANFIFTKNITGIAGQTLQGFAPLSVLLSNASNNVIKKIVFILEAGSNLTAQSVVQNLSCFNAEGDNIKLAQNPVGATTNVFFEMVPNNAMGENLDLRTAIRFTATGGVSIIMYF